MSRIDWPEQGPSWRTRLLVSGAWIGFLVILAVDWGR